MRRSLESRPLSEVTLLKGLDFCCAWGMVASCCPQVVESLSARRSARYAKQCEAECRNER
eukprot:4889065-Amphidinium_carterae.1